MPARFKTCPLISPSNTTTTSMERRNDDQRLRGFLLLLRAREPTGPCPRESSGFFADIRGTGGDDRLGPYRTGGWLGEAGSVASRLSSTCGGYSSEPGHDRPTVHRSVAAGGHPSLLTTSR